MVEKQSVLNIIDSVMNNREIDSIRNAILAIRDQVVDMKDDGATVQEFCEPIETSYAKLKIRGNNPPCQVDEGWYDGAKYLVMDMEYKIDSGVYGAYWYE